MQLFSVLMQQICLDVFYNYEFFKFPPNLKNYGVTSVSINRY
jgi:hypothetical protein